MRVQSKFELGQQLHPASAANGHNHNAPADDGDDLSINSENVYELAYRIQVLKTMSLGLMLPMDTQTRSLMQCQLNRSIQTLDRSGVEPPAVAQSNSISQAALSSRVDRDGNTV